MQVSSARLNTVRAALGVLILLALFWGVTGVFFPEQAHRMNFPKETFTMALQAMNMVVGTFALTWTVAAAIALRDPLRRRSLMQALVVALAMLSIVNLYFAFVLVPLPAAGWISTALLIILAVVMGVAYPWRQAAK